MFTLTVYTYMSMCSLDNVCLNEHVFSDSVCLYEHVYSDSVCLYERVSGVSFRGGRWEFSPSTQACFPCYF